MKGTVTLTEQDQLRIRTLNRVVEGTLTGSEAAEQLGVSVRHLRRLVAPFDFEPIEALLAWRAQYHGLRQRLLV